MANRIEIAAGLAEIRPDFTRRSQSHKAVGVTNDIDFIWSSTWKAKDLTIRNDHKTCVLVNESHGDYHVCMGEQRMKDGKWEGED
jgi:hypothetical protein